MLGRSLLMKAGGEAVTGDPFFSSVVLLLHGDGTNGSTSIIDSSPSSKAVTAVGDARISTAQSMFSGSSIVFDGSGDYLVVVGSETNPDFDFGTLNFTIEAWIMLAVNNFFSLAAKRPAASPSGWQVSSGDFSARIGGIWRQSVISVPNPAINTWTHIALTRSGNSFRMFYNGLQVGSTYTQSGSLEQLTTHPLRIGVAGGTSELFANGFMNELRITKGVARYTANFNPPTTPFPDF